MVLLASGRRWSRNDNLPRFTWPRPGRTRCRVVSRCSFEVEEGDVVDEVLRNASKRVLNLKVKRKK